MAGLDFTRLVPDVGLLPEACGGGGEQAGVAHIGVTRTDRTVAAAPAGATPAAPASLTPPHVTAGFAGPKFSGGSASFPLPAGMDPNLPYNPTSPITRRPTEANDHDTHIDDRTARGRGPA